jgi:hypothetical protein
MPLTLDTFRAVANSATITSRDIEIQGKGANATARLGAYVFSAGKKSNDAVMAAFKAALEKEYGVFGTHAFDTVLGSRQQLHKSLRACDVKAALSKLDSVKKTRFVGELNRQLDTNPKFRTLSPELRQKIRDAIADAPFEGADPRKCKSQAELQRLAVKRLDDAIRANRTGDRGEVIALDGRKRLEQAVGDREPTGLRNLRSVFREKETSIEDKIKKGRIGAGMRVNRSNTNPVLLEKLKTNGVEPGFIFRNDWSKDDTHGFMADIRSPASRDALDRLKEKNPELRRLCEGKPLREQIMLAGRAHPAGMAAVAEFVLEAAVASALNPNPPANDPFKDLARALKDQFSVDELQRLRGAVSDPKNKAILKEAKLELFTEIRDTVMSIGPKGATRDFYAMSPIFKHFSDRAIVKLDYNEGSKFSEGDSASAGTFMRPERVVVGRKMGQLYRFTSRQSADKISAGAVTEALANDLTRLAGVPSQELEIIRGKYSDGHPKIMLSAKFAVGYRDMEDKMLKDGRAVPPPRGKGKNAPVPPEPEPLGKYKAFFLLTADRDGVGKRGQNKGFIDGRFFAIDPGHSLEGNGKYLDISDDFSFRDTFGKSSKPRFNNFSVFDDDTRFAKLSGLIELRNVAKSGAFEKLFADYKAAFDPNEAGISPAEKTLRTKICAEIDEKKAEFDQQLARLMKVFDPQLRLHDDLAARGPAVQEKAVNTISHLEMLTSTTTWTSKHGEVALKHLEVKPETRVPWRAEVVGNDIVYHCSKPLDGSTVSMLQGLAANAGVRYEYDNWGNSRLVVPQGAAERFFAVFSEDSVQKLTHPAEYMARKEGGDPLAVAKDYKPVAYKKIADPRPPITADQLPDELDIPVEGGVIKFPRIHYETMATTRSSVSRPRSVDELRASLEARIRRGNDILRALRDGNTELFEPTRDNVVAVTHALHAAALRKGEFMYRGSFSVADPDGNIARWLDRAENLYLRTSTHAKPFHSVNVDGHLNMPRGLDIPEGMGGLLNGMRTFHFFTIPDPDGLATNGGSGPKRRLFLKCETFGIYCSTANFHPFDKADAKSEGMQTRSYRPGDIIESIFHGASLLRSFGTDKEADGIRKENLLEATKEVIEVAEANLRGIGEDALADLLVLNVTGKGAGVRQLMDNLAAVVENLPADENKRAEVTDILEDLLAGIERTAGHLTGNISHRMGNEIMID